jgi:hypothetical protein
MYVNCFDGEKLFLWKFVISTLCWCSLGWRCYSIYFKLSKLIVSIFGLFQCLELIKYMLFLCLGFSFQGSNFFYWFILWMKLSLSNLLVHLFILHMKIMKDKTYG